MPPATGWSVTGRRVLEKAPPLDLLNRLDLSREQLSRVPAILEANGVQSNEWTPEMMAAFRSLRQHLLSPADWRRLEAAMSAPPTRLVPRVADFLRRHRLLPEAFIYGLCVCLGNFAGTVWPL